MAWHASRALKRMDQDGLFPMKHGVDRYETLQRREFVIIRNTKLPVATHVTDWASMARALHDLCQPLTSLDLLLEMAR